MTEPSALGNIKKFRTIFDQATEEGLLIKNPFKRLKLSNRSPRKPRYSIEQLSRSKSFEITLQNMKNHTKLHFFVECVVWKFKSTPPALGECF